MQSDSVTSKTNPGNFFEDFSVGQVLEHATPRTVTEGDRALYGALYPTRFAIPSSAEFAEQEGASVGGEPSAPEVGDDGLGAEPGEAQRVVATVCHSDGLALVGPDVCYPGAYKE